VINPDFRDLFSAFGAHDVRFLVVGAYAVTFHSRPRFTKDLDVWIDPEPRNAERAWRALAAFGAPLSGVKPEDFTRPEAVYQIGIAPNRIDVLTSITAVDFAMAWSRRVPSEYGGAPIHVLGREDLIANKRAVGRPRDLEDAAELERGAG
jgi:hypothetical protein